MLHCSTASATGGMMRVVALPRPTCMAAVKQRVEDAMLQRRIAELEAQGG